MQWLLGALHHLLVRSSVRCIGMRKSVSLIVLFVVILLCIPVEADSDRIYNITKAYSYSSVDYNVLEYRLVNKYKELLTLEEIGKSANGRPIVAIRLSTTKDGEDDYVTKQHILVEAGPMHERY